MSRIVKSGGASLGGEGSVRVRCNAGRVEASVAPLALRSMLCVRLDASCQHALHLLLACAPVPPQRHQALKRPQTGQSMGRLYG